MNGIQLMVEEHVYIKRLLKVMRQACYELMIGKRFEIDDFKKMIDFVRNYADAHHHGKEEKMLFNRMITEIGGPAEKLVRGGMLVEHDLGRFFISELEKAVEKVAQGEDEARLDVIANGIGYTELLHRHIGKEDEVCYTFAERALSKETIDQINKECEAFEEKAQEKGIQENYIELLKGLEVKYL